MGDGQFHVVISVDKNAFRRWNECIAEITSNNDPGRVLGLLAEGCQAFLPADATFAAVYGEARKPVLVYDDVPLKNRVGVIDSYVDGAYLLDPFYRGGIDRVAQGLYHLRDIGPPGFKRSEFYRKYYYQSGIRDEIGFLTYLHDGCFANFSLVKMEGSNKFARKDIEKLELAQAVVHQTLINYWKRQASETVAPSSKLHSQLEVALTRFGNSVLTDREAEVIRLYLKGHSTASITERLGISYHTVSTHRKSAYQKLDINSQGELFHLFIDSLSCFDPVTQRDPLRNYLSVAK